MSFSTKLLGLKGENIACKYLSDRGFIIKQRNYKNKIGEIDIIASQDNEIVFVEVKTRNSTKFGYPEEAVTKKKLNKIVKCAQLHILKNDISKNYRVDVVSILFENEIVKRIKHIKNV